MVLAPVCSRLPSPVVGIPTVARLRRAVVVAAIGVTVLAVLLLAGTVRDDFTIRSDEGRATADVLSVSPFFAAISFTTPDVEYARGNPDLVRVTGRDARLAVIPAGSLVVVAWMIAGGLWLLLRRSARRSALAHR